MRTLLAAVGALAIGAASASAQVPAERMEIVRVTDGPSSVEATVGVSTGSGQTGAVLGGAGVVGLNERFAVEGTGAWLDRGRATTSIAASANLRINLMPGADRFAPYAVVGAGLFYTRFDMDEMMAGVSGRVAAGTLMQPLGGQYGFGMMGGGYMPGFGSGTAFGPGYGGYFGTYTPGSMPGFYAARFGALRVPADGRWGSRAFTDPAVTLGGGARLDVTRRLFIRPDARALVVIGGGHTNTLGMFSLGVGVTF